MESVVVNFYDDLPNGSFNIIDEILNMGFEVYVSTPFSHLINGYSTKVSRVTIVPNPMPIHLGESIDKSVNEIIRISYGYWANSIYMVRGITYGKSYKVCFASVASQIKLDLLDKVRDSEMNFLYVDGLALDYPYYFLPKPYNFFSDVATVHKLTHFWKNLRHWDILNDGYNFFLDRFAKFPLENRDEKFGNYLWYMWCINQAIRLRPMGNR